MTSWRVLRYIEPVDLLEFSLEAWRKTPEMRVQDAYKWLFHATMGGEHAISDEVGVRAWMDREWEEIGEPFADEPIIEPLDPEHRVVRVNLRPYKSRGFDKDELLEVFISSARQFRGDKKDFLEVWNSLGEILSASEFGYLDAASWRELDGIARKADYAAIHHSAEYEAAYAPAYRVVTGETAGTLSPMSTLKKQLSGNWPE